MAGLIKRNMKKPPIKQVTVSGAMFWNFFCKKDMSKFRTQILKVQLFSKYMFCKVTEKLPKTRADRTR